jgi:hypothetical protein
MVEISIGVDERSGRRRVRVLVPGSMKVEEASSANVWRIIWIECLGDWLTHEEIIS